MLGIGGGQMYAFSGVDSKHFQKSIRPAELAVKATATSARRGPAPARTATDLPAAARRFDKRVTNGEHIKIAPN